MKKILIPICILFAFIAAYNPANAQTGKEALQACVNAMKVNQMIDSFNTMSVKMYMYAQGQKVILKIYSKETADKESLIRFEQSFNGKEETYVFLGADEEFFKVAPQYEELDISAGAQLFQLMDMAFPLMDLPQILKDTTGRVILDVVGTEEFNGKKCKKIGIAVKPEGDTAADKPEYKQYLYTDEVSNFLHGIEMPEPKLKLVLENMKRIKGSVYPAVIKIMVDNKKQSEIEIDKIEANIELEDSLFAKPN